MRRSPQVSMSVRHAFLVTLSALSAASCGNSGQPGVQPSGGSGGAASAGMGGSVEPGASGGAPGTGGTVAPAPSDAGTETVPSVDAPAATDANPGDGGDMPNTRTGVLLYTYRTGFRHTSAVPASMVLRDKLTALGYSVQIEDADNNLFTDENLAKYRLVVLVQSSGEPMGTGTAEADALIKFVRDGGALAGFHAAAIVRPYPPTHPYVGLLGGQFTGHPGGLRKATCTPVAGASHPAIARITAPFQQMDEIFTFAAMNPGNQVILNCANPNGDPLPITWYRSEGAGRVFYTGLGHGDELWTAHSTFVNDHFFPGVLWTVGR